MKIEIKIHEEGGGYWAEVPSLPGCASQGDTYEELMSNIREAIEGWLMVDAEIKIKELNKKMAELHNAPNKNVGSLEIVV